MNIVTVKNFWLAKKFENETRCVTGSMTTSFDFFYTTYGIFTNDKYFVRWGGFDINSSCISVSLFSFSVVISLLQLWKNLLYSVYAFTIITSHIFQCCIYGFPSLLVLFIPLNGNTLRRSEFQTFMSSIPSTPTSRVIVVPYTILKHFSSLPGVIPGRGFSVLTIGYVSSPVPTPDPIFLFILPSL